MNEAHWGLLVAAYLFLAGAGAGTVFISGYYVLSDRIKQDSQRQLACYSAIAGSILLMIGTTMIILDLTTFRAGIVEFDLDKFFRFINFFKTFRTSSIMSMGSWLVSLAIGASTVYVLAFFKQLPFHKYLRPLAAINMLFAIGVSSYTAFLLGDITHNFVWSSSILVTIFMISALSAGLAVVLLVKTIIRAPSEPNQAFEKVDALTLTLELILLLIFTYSIYSLSGFNGIDFPLAISSKAGLLWFFGVIGLGLLIPLALNLKAVLTRTALSHSKEYLLSIAVLTGGFCLRYAVLLAGQYH